MITNKEKITGGVIATVRKIFEKDKCDQIIFNSANIAMFSSDFLGKYEVFEQNVCQFAKNKFDRLFNKLL